MVCGDAPSLAVSRQIFRSSSSVKTSTIFNSTGPMWLSFSKNLARCAQRVRGASSTKSATASRYNSSRLARTNSSYDSDCCFFFMFDTLERPGASPAAGPERPVCYVYRTAARPAE
jgi:hypothetical protein